MYRISTEPPINYNSKTGICTIINIANAIARANSSVTISETNDVRQKQTTTKNTHTDNLLCFHWAQTTLHCHNMLLLMSKSNSQEGTIEMLLLFCCCFATSWTNSADADRDGSNKNQQQHGMGRESERDPIWLGKIDTWDKEGAHCVYICDTVCAAAEGSFGVNVNSVAGRKTRFVRGDSLICF